VARNLIPYGQLPNGNYGINLDNTTGDPRAAALEVLDSLPAVANADNFPGRLVFATDVATMFVYSTSPTTQWIPLEGVPATIGLSDGSPTDPKPPVIGNEVPGALFWTTDTEVLFVWDGLQWQAAGGRYATNVIERRYVGDNLTTGFALGIGQAIPTELIEVFIDGVRQNSLTVEPGTGDYSVVGTAVVFVTPPVLNAEVFLRSYKTVQLSATAKVVVPVPNPVVSSGSQEDFPVGAAGVELDSIYVIVDGETKTRGFLGDVNTISKVLPGDTSAVVVTAAPHGITVVGTTVTIIGADVTTSQYNNTFPVTTITDNVTFEILVLASDPPAAIPSPQLEFSIADYEVVQQDTSIVSIVKAFAGDVIATVTTTAPHGIPGVGIVVELGGALEPQYNGAFTVATNPPSNSTFEISVLASDPISATPDPILFFSPPFVGDVVEFFLPINNSSLVDIRSFKSLIVAPSAGEANVLAQEPASTGSSVVGSKVGVTLNTKGIKAGSNISISSDASDLTITATTGANFESRIEANGSLILPGLTVSYVGVTDTILPGANIVVDLSASGATSGRKIIVKDEGGAANSRNIEITGPFGATFDGAAAPYVISSDRGAVTLVYDNANNWNIVSEKI